MDYKCQLNIIVLLNCSLMLFLVFCIADTNAKTNVIGDISTICSPMEQNLFNIQIQVNNDEILQSCKISNKVMDSRNKILYTEHYTLMTYHELGYIGRTQPCDRCPFAPDKYGRTKQQLDNAYFIVNIDTVLKQQTNNALDPAKNVNHQLNRGHLVPYGDFDDIDKKSATNYYVNVAPQFIVVNSGSWNEIEMKIRRYASRNPLKIYTGTWGKTKYNNVPLYIGTFDNRLMIPNWFWKIAIDERNNEGMAFVTVNNVFESDVTLCTTNLCGSNNARSFWYHEDFSNVNKGLTKCCKISDFLENVGFTNSVLLKLKDNYDSPLGSSKQRAPAT